MKSPGMPCSPVPEPKAERDRTELGALHILDREIDVVLEIGHVPIVGRRVGHDADRRVMHLQGAVDRFDRDRLAALVLNEECAPATMPCGLPSPRAGVGTKTMSFTPDSTRPPVAKLERTTVSVPAAAMAWLGRYPA